MGGLVGPVLLGCRNEVEHDPGASAFERLDGPIAVVPARDGTPEDRSRLDEWVGILRAEGFVASDVPFARTVVRVGELALGTPYEAYTLEQYIHAGESPIRSEPLTLSLTRFDCVSLIEACLAVARVARGDGDASLWDRFAREMERVRYRDGVRGGYSSRLHYFSEWLSDGARRGLVEVMGPELGAAPDTRPLRFMSRNPDSYPAMAHEAVRDQIALMERSLDGAPRWVIPTAAIPAHVGLLESGDILAFATSIDGLDVTHAAFAYRDSQGIMRVLHAPLSGGVVEITAATIPQYVAAIRQATGIIVARPVQGSTG